MIIFLIMKKSILLSKTPNSIKSKTIFFRRNAQNRNYIQTHCNDRRNTFRYACRQWYTYMNTIIPIHKCKKLHLQNHRNHNFINSEHLYEYHQIYPMYHKI